METNTHDEWESESERDRARWIGFSYYLLPNRYPPSCPTLINYDIAQAGASPRSLMSPFFFVSPPLKERAEKNGSIRDSTSSSLESICNNYLKLFRGDRRERKVCEGRDICRVQKTVSKQYSVSYVSFIVPYNKPK